MAVATFKDLCIDSSDSEVLGRFWAAVLGLRFEADDAAGVLVGDDPGQRIWMNVVPEAKSVKHRVHLDVHTTSVDDLVELGATVLEPAEQYHRRWSVMADPEGGEFCAFVRPAADVPSYRLYELSVDCRDAGATASWWADVFGARLGHDREHGWWWLDDVPGAPFESWVFVDVPEPKTVKNRLHWDVTAESADVLVEAGAQLRRVPDGEISWCVLADPEGNEFCTFAP